MHSRNRALDRPQGCVQKFCKGGANLGYFKKRGGGGGGGSAAASSVRESTGRQCLSLVILKGGGQD